MQSRSPTHTPPPPHQLDPEILAISDAFTRIATQDPRIPGVRDLLKIEKSNLGHGLTSSDLEILTGALYLEAERQLHAFSSAQHSVVSSQAVPEIPSPTRQRRPINTDDVKAALSKPINTAPYGREYIETILRDAKENLATDPGFQTQLNGAQASASALRKKIDTPIWIRTIIVIIIIIIVVVVITL